MDLIIFAHLLCHIGSIYSSAETAGKSDNKNFFRVFLCLLIKGQIFLRRRLACNRQFFFCSKLFKKTCKILFCLQRKITVRKFCFQPDNTDIHFLSFLSGYIRSRVRYDHHNMFSSFSGLTSFRCFSKIYVTNVSVEHTISYSVEKSMNLLINETKRRKLYQWDAKKIPVTF